MSESEEIRLISIVFLILFIASCVGYMLTEGVIIWMLTLFLFFGFIATIKKDGGKN